MRGREKTHNVNIPSELLSDGRMCSSGGVRGDMLLGVTDPVAEGEGSERSARGKGNGESKGKEDSLRPKCKAVSESAVRRERGQLREG